MNIFSNYAILAIHQIACIMIIRKGNTKPHKLKEVHTMSTIEIVSKIEALKEWEAMAAEAAAEIEALKDTIKKEMDGRGVEVIEAGQYIARFTTVQSSRFDTSALPS